MASYKDRFLNQLGTITDEITGYRDEYLDAFGTVTNKNQTYTDTSLRKLGKVTLNSYYSPIRRIKNNNQYLNSHAFIATPPGYMRCNIQLYYGGSPDHNIPMLFPESISESISANFVKESPVGSTNPIIAFSNTQPQEFSIQFTALADYLPTGYSTLRQYIEDIKTMCKPRYQNQNNLVLAPSVLVSYSDISFYGVCDSVSVEYEPVYNVNSMVVAKVNCSFTVGGA